MNEEQMRAEFEAWWANFQSEHEEWKYADREAILFQAWQAALSSQSAKSEHDYASMVVMEFNGERVPQFSQGYQSHELLEVVTAERCQQLVKLIDASLASDERVREFDITAIRLAIFNGKCEVSIEVGGKWVKVIEDSGSVISHIVEKSGIEKAIDEAMKEANK